MHLMILCILTTTFLLVLVSAVPPAGAREHSGNADDAAGTRGVLTGEQVLCDWISDAPGLRRRITLDDLAEPYATPSANKFPRTVTRREGAWPMAPKGFQVTEFAHGLGNPRTVADRSQRRHLRGREHARAH